MYEYLQKYPKRNLVITNQEFHFEYPDDPKTIWTTRPEDMKKYYPDALDEWDPKYPNPLGEAVSITIFIDADHAKSLDD